MSRPREIEWKGPLLELLTAFLLATGLSLCVLEMLLPGQGTGPVLVICLVSCTVLEALFTFKFKGKPFILLGIFALLCVWGALGGGPVHELIQLGKATVLSLRSVSGALLPYADAMRAFLCVLICLLAVLISGTQELVLACILVVGTAAACFLLRGDRLVLILPAFAGLLVKAAMGRPRVGALAVAAVLTALAFLLTPAAPPVVPELEQAAADIREFLEDYLFFREYRAAFTLSSEGYKPEKDRLGGPAAPVREDVMEVETGETLLLRACTYDAYTGLDWYDSLSARRYLYQSPRLDSLKETTFDLRLPLTGQEGLKEKRLHVKMLSDAATTLFVPQRTRTITPESERMVLYFNTASELFITRNLAAGDEYSLSYLSFSPGSERTRALVNACAELRDAHYAQVAQDYLKLPEHIQKEVRQIAEEATRGCETPLEKALALQAYLQRNYKYSLDVETPPENVDFTAWFLLGEKKGYCTYFANAMTVLSRLCGLPARYVTGFLAVPDESGRAVVTGEDAHAWTEIYFNGFGWLEFDATPRGDNRRDEDDGDDPTVPPPPVESPTPTPPPEEPPTPSPSPTETPSPAPEASPTPPPDEPRETPTPDEPPRAPEPPEERNRFPWYLLAVVLLLLLLLARVWWTEPLRRAARRPKDAPEILTRATLALLALRRVKRAPQETLSDFGKRADEALRGAGLPPVSDLMDVYAAWVYGRHEADAEEFARVYRACRRRAGWSGRAYLALRRAFSRG